MPAVDAVLAQVEAEIARRDPIRKGTETFFRCPFPDRHEHDDAHPSARWNRSKTAWTCDVCHAGGGYRDLAQALGIALGASKPGPAKETMFDYRDAGNVRRFQVVQRRYPDGSKRVYQRRPTGRGEWVNNLEGVTPFLYRLPELIAADPAEEVHVHEGEPCVEAARALDFTATTNPGGAGKWRNRYSEPLRGRHVAIFPDNDQAGRRHTAEVAASCYGIVASVRIIHLPDLPEKGDLVDWIAAGHTAEELQELIDASPLWAPPLDGQSAALPIRTMAQVAPEHVEFLWPRRIAFRKLNLIAGIQGEGKSTVLLDLAARMSRGAELPDGGMAPR